VPPQPPFDPNWKEVDGLPKQDWLQAFRAVRRDPESFSLTRLGDTRCKGGYCKRHGRSSRPIAFITSDGDPLCNECGLLWATHKHFGIPTTAEDL